MVTVAPSAGATVSNLTQVTVTFNRAVAGVQAEDLILNGSSGTSVTGSGMVYSFAFSPPSPGIVEASWNGAHNISDLSGERLSDLGANTIWEYTLIDTVAPVASTINPVAGSTLGHITQVSVTFSEPVAGVDAADLLVNGQPATQVAGQGPGPYTFTFPTPTPGLVQLGWAPNHGIHDLASSPNAFPSGSWSYTFHIGEFSGDIVINEFLAFNTSTNGLRDEDGELQDWIELHNHGNAPVSLNGWSLTADPAQPDMWSFPSISLGAGEYLVVYASGKDRRPTNGGKVHANFKLSTRGQYLGLFNADFPRDVATEFYPASPEQMPGISYGLYNGSFTYLTNPSPGAANSGPASFSGVAADPEPSVGSGFFNQPFSLSFSTSTPGASIRYSLDGSEPTGTSGILYTGPIAVAGTPAKAVINVRATAFRDDLSPSHVVTRSYFFPSYVLLQPTNPPGFPTAWITQTNALSTNATIVPADYQMDPRIFTNSGSAALAAQALTNLPTVSLVGDIDDLFSQHRGIYANPNPGDAERVLWERPASAELLLPDGTSAFRTDAGLRIHGSTSRDPNWTRKHSFRLLFKSTYGGKLDYRLFPDSPADSFHTLVLSAGFNISWNDRYEAGGTRAQFVRDQFCSNLQAAMGGTSAHGQPVHLYVNGLYWGLYNLHERPDENFAATYFDGPDSQFDVVRNSAGLFEVTAGDTNAWSAMLELVNSDLSSYAQYQQLRQYLDVDSFIDYMIVNHFAGNTDWANHNWYAIRKRAPGAGFQFVSWDAEIVMKSITENVTGYNQAASPTMIHSFLRNSADYRLKFADHVQKQFFGGGPLWVDTNSPSVDPSHPERNRPGALYMGLINRINAATVLESARWGDSVPARLNSPFTRENDFLPELVWMTNNFFPQRSAVVLNQYRTVLLYPGPAGVAPPGFNQQGGNVPYGFQVNLTGLSGTIYYTTDGSDPRVEGSGEVSTNASAYAGTPFTIRQTTVVKARALNGANWSPLSEATFAVAQLLLPLRITEIMYQPIGGRAYQFLELQNLGSTTLDLSGCSISGISFMFPAGLTVAPQAVIVLASDLNPTAFAARYPNLKVAAWFPGELAGNGERLAVLDALGQPVIAVNYSSTNGWPLPVGGFSIEINDPAGDPNDPANWRLSASANGTPGTLSPLPSPNQVLINEVQAINAGTFTNAGTSPAWIELANTGTNSASLANWTLTTDSNSRRFEFPATASIASGGFLLLFCDSQTNAPGLHTGFNLNAQGDHLFLSDAQGRRVDAFSYGVQVPKLSVGRLAGNWQLTSPTPKAPNLAAVLGTPSNLVINEWLANSAPGQSDWLELYNPSNQPVPLRGLYVGTSNALFQITSLSFVPPGGYIQLFADQLPGPNHLGFNLPATGGQLILEDAFGTVIDRVLYAPQVDGISQGRVPDGSANILSFPGSSSPGTTNFLVSHAGARLNELMARNDSAVLSPWGQYADWVELYNPGTNSVNLSGMSLSANKALPGDWRFPPGTTLASGAYRTVWLDGARPPSTNAEPDLNLGESLDGDGGEVYLFDASGQVADFIEYGRQIGNQSIGRSGASWRLLTNPTPGAPNAAAMPLGNPANVRINEWMAEPADGSPWFELYNPDSQPVELAGLFLSDDPSINAQTRFVIHPLSFVSGLGWVSWVADGHPSRGRNHVNFRLNPSGESLRIYGQDLALIDAVDFGTQLPNISEGRLPDGGTAIVRFETTPTPGEGNYLPLTNVAISEVLTHSDPPLEDAIELVNLSTYSVNIGGWYLSDSQSLPRKFRIPDSTRIPPGGFRVFYQNQFDPTPGVFPSFALDSAHGDTLYLSEADAAGNLTGHRAGVRFGAAENGASFGRFTNSTGVEFVTMSRRTFGVDAPATLDQFRLGSGLLNAYPKVGPVVINEIMYDPVGIVGDELVENPANEFVELYNFSTNSVPLYDLNFPSNTWALKGGIDFPFPRGTTMPPQTYLVLVRFDPISDPVQLTAFRDRYGLDNSIPVLGPFEGRLANEGDKLELYKPDAPSPAPDLGFVPQILVDRVSYLPGPPWRTAAAGGGASLQRRVPSSFGDNPFNWKAEPPTAGHTNIQTGVVPPIVTFQPQSQSVRAGAAVTFSVGATGSSPISYLWQRDGIDLPASTNASLTIASAQLIHSGIYRVWLTNAAGFICSQPAALKVSQAPLITAQPLSLLVTQGGNATFHVAVLGTPPLAYQWYLNGVPLPGNTTADLALNLVAANDAGAYRAVVTNAAGMTVSYFAYLRVAGFDGDGDGIPDSWMIQNFGHASGMASDLSRPRDDADGDGMSNLQEYLAGTNPLDAQSRLKLDLNGMNPGTGQLHFSFTAVAGIGYTLQYCDNLALGNWQRLRDVPPDPATRTVAVDDPAAPIAPARYYRVVTPMQPFTDGDTDGDGIPDSWMVQHFGHAPAMAADRSRAQDDPDGDGMSNLQEYLAGTDPLDPRSSLRLRPAGVNLLTGRPDFAFSSVAGVGYTLQYCDNLASGIWRWLRDVPPGLANRVVLVEDPAAAVAPIRFYRVVTPIQPSSTADSDNDGIPDLWMVQNFGHPTGTAADNSRAEDDPDGDSMSNLQEYLAGTDPLDPLSCLRLFARILPGTGQLQLSFTAVTGVGYTVQYSDELASNVWHKLTDIQPGTSTRIAILNDPEFPNSPARFYRIVTPLQP